MWTQALFKIHTVTMLYEKFQLNCSLSVLFIELHFFLQFQFIIIFLSNISSIFISSRADCRIRDQHPWKFATQNQRLSFLQVIYCRKYDLLVLRAKKPISVNIIWHLSLYPIYIFTIPFFLSSCQHRCRARIKTFKTTNEIKYVSIQHTHDLTDRKNKKT